MSLQVLRIVRIGDFYDQCEHRIPDIPDGMGDFYYVIGRIGSISTSRVKPGLHIVVTVAEHACDNVLQSILQLSKYQLQIFRVKDEYNDMETEPNLNSLKIVSTNKFLRFSQLIWRPNLNSRRSVAVSDFYDECKHEICLSGTVLVDQCFSR